MEPACPLGTTRCIPQAKFHQKPYNKSFIDQVCSVKMAGYWPRSFFASLWTSTSSRSINTQKTNLANLAILTSHLVNNPYLLTTEQLDLKVHALHYANDYLYASGFPFKNFHSLLNMQRQYEKMFGKRVMTRTCCR